MKPSNLARTHTHTRARVCQPRPHVAGPHVVAAIVTVTAVVTVAVTVTVTVAVTVAVVVAGST